MQFSNRLHQRNCNPLSKKTNNENQSMTREEIQIALSFLKIRFRESSVDDIIASLTRHLQLQNQKEKKKQQERDSRLYGRSIPQQLEPNIERVSRSERTIDFVDDLNESESNYRVSESNQMRLINLQETRIVAMIFRTVGINYATIRQLLPNMSAQKYRFTINKINTQAFKSIQDFLRDQCNIQIQYITAEQKKVLIKHLQKVRDWLGKISMLELDTYYKFIERQYQPRQVEVTYDEAMRIYKTLLKIVKSPYVDHSNYGLHEFRQNVQMRQRDVSQMMVEQLNPPQRRTNCLQNTAVIEQYSKQELKEIVNEYLNLQSIQLVSQRLQRRNNKNNNEIKWNEQSIKAVLRYTIKKTIQKIKVFARQQKITKQKVLFGTSEQQIKSLLQSEYFRQKLLRAYTDRKISASGLSGLIRSMNRYLNKRIKDEISSIEIKIQDDDESSRGPKLELQSKRVKEEGNQANNDYFDKVTEATEQEVKEQYTSTSRMDYSFKEVIEIE